MPKERDYTHKTLDFLLRSCVDKGSCTKTRGSGNGPGAIYKAHVKGAVMQLTYETEPVSGYVSIKKIDADHDFLVMAFFDHHKDQLPVWRDILVEGSEESFRNWTLLFRLGAFS